MTRTLVLKGSHGSGFGDMIRCLLVAIAYAKLSERQLVVDWRGGLYNHFPVEKNLFDDLFQAIDILIADYPPATDSIYPPRWIGELHKTFARVYEEDGEPRWNRQAAIQKYSFDLGRMDYDHDVLVMWDFDQFAKLRSAMTQKLMIPMDVSDNEAMGILFRRHLCLNPNIEKRLNEAWDPIPKDDGIIGVHVRLTQESVRARGAISLRDYYQAIEKLAKNGEARLFLATDNQFVQQQFKSRYQNKVFVNPKWLDKAGEPLHLGNKRCPNSWENIVGAMLDMFMLAQCDALIYPANSSFSIVSRFVGDISAERVVALHLRVSLLRRVRNKVVHWIRRFG